MTARYWVPVNVTGAVNNGSGLIRLTLALVGGGATPTSTWATNDHVNVSSVGGVTNANGSWVITVIDPNEIDLQGSTFAGTYTSGGICNHDWTGTNTANWAATTGGNGGGAVPGASGDQATFDANSGSGTITVNTTVTLGGTRGGLNLTGFGGHLDFSANNNNVTIGVSAFGDTSGTHTLSMGSGTWTFTGLVAGAGVTWSMGNASCTLNHNNSVMNFNVTSMNNAIRLGGKTYGTINLQTAGKYDFQVAGATIQTFTTVAGVSLAFATGQVFTFTNAPTFTGTRTSPIHIGSGTAVATTTPTLTPSSGTISADWCVIESVVAGGSGGTATNTHAFGTTTGWTITPPAAAGGGSGVIGG